MISSLFFGKTQSLKKIFFHESIYQLMLAQDFKSLIVYKNSKGIYCIVIVV